jgi:hypothetical protein
VSPHIAVTSWAITQVNAELARRRREFAEQAWSPGSVVYLEKLSGVPS